MLSSAATGWIGAGEEPLPGSFVAEELIDGLKVFGRATIEAVTHGLRGRMIRRLDDDSRLERTDEDGVFG